MTPKLTSELKLRKPIASPQEEALLQILRTADQLNRALSDFFRPFNISTTQYNVLRILRGAGPAGLSCGEIGERMITREPDITRLLDRIERQGWLERHRQSDDRRVVRAWITPAGLERLATIDKPLEQFNRRQFKSFSREQLAELCSLMESVRETE